MQGALDSTLSFDLVVATVGRVREPETLLESLVRQDYPSVRVLLVDQNADDRMAPVVERFTRRLEIVHLRAPVGASHARNVGLAAATADVVALPDDDCTYPPGLLVHVSRLLHENPTWDGLVGRIVDPSGLAAELPRELRPTRLDLHNAWGVASAITVFVRRSAALRIGPWDERIGPGASTTWDNGEDTDWLLRGVLAGLDLRYDPKACVLHADPFFELDARARALAYRYGQGTTYLLHKHRLGAATIGRFLARPAIGAAVSLRHGDVRRARLHAAALRGRIVGGVKLLAGR